jgi:hypothetical protein
MVIGCTPLCAVGCDHKASARLTGVSNQDVENVAETVDRSSEGWSTRRVPNHDILGQPREDTMQCMLLLSDGDNWVRRPRNKIRAIDNYSS